MKEHVLVPLAGISELQVLIPHLRRLVRRGVSRITLVHAELPASIEGFELLRDAALTHARSLLARAKRRLAGLKVPVQIVAAIGAPSETILDVARERKATLILLTGTHRSGFARLLFGSVSEQVVRRSPVPVVVVPSTPERKTAGAGF